MEPKYFPCGVLNGQGKIDLLASSHKSSPTANLPREWITISLFSLLNETRSIKKASSSPRQLCRESPHPVPVSSLQHFLTTSPQS